jgi:tRNA (uracil-5-)-methyltransferase
MEITKTHKISKFAVFDQFPYTDHLECGAFLEKKSEE